MWSDEEDAPLTPLVLDNNKPLTREAYAKYFRNYTPAEPNAEFKHWHHTFHVGVHFEICNLPEIGAVVFLVKEQAAVMLTFGQLNWILAAENNYENRDENDVTKARLHFYLPDCTTIITDNEDEHGVWQALKFVQMLEPRPKPIVELGISRFEFGQLKGSILGLMHKVVEEGGQMSEGLGTDGHIYRSIVCPHCKPEIKEEEVGVAEVEEGGDEVDTLVKEMVDTVVAGDGCGCPYRGEYVYPGPYPHNDDCKWAERDETDRAIVSTAKKADYGAILNLKPNVHYDISDGPCSK